MKITSKGQVTLPAEYRRAISARTGDRLTLMVDDEGLGTLSKAADDLSIVHDIVKRARAEGAKRSRAEDPIGDFLLAEDDRTKRER